MNIDFSRAVGKLVWPNKPRSALARYSVALVLPVISIVISDLFFSLSRAPFFILFMLSLMFAAVYGGWKSGLVCTLVSGLLNWVILPPSFSMNLEDPESLARLIIFCLAGFGISGFAGAISSLQQNLDAQRERYRVTLSSIGDAVIATDVRGYITFMNPVAEAATGWKRSEARGKRLGEVFRIVNEATREPVENPIRRVFASGRIVGLAKHTILLRRNGSELPIDDSAAPIRDASGQTLGAVLVFRDITKQKEFDAALIRSEKLASVGRLAATIAHEINNPLEVISNLLFLIKKTPDRDDMGRYVSTAEHELNRVSAVTKQMLLFATRENKHEMIEIADLIDGMLVLSANKIQTKNVAVRKKCEPHVRLCGTKSEVSQVLGNLIGNALEAMEPNGTLYIRTRTGEWDGRPVARIVVADTGHGIPAENMPKLFDAFFTTSIDIGTGLGLWLTKQILDSHGGQIRARSVVGKGTVMNVYWPAVEERASQKFDTTEAITE